MKKAAWLVAAFALVGAGLFADGVSVGGWGRAVFLPYVSQTGGDAQTTIANSYGSTPEYDVNVVGTTANAGFEYDFKYTFGTSISTGNNAFAWVNPVDGVRLAVGTIKDWTMQGNGTFGDWDFLRFSYAGENLTFTRVNVSGAELSYTQGPLFVYGALDKLAGAAPYKFFELAQIASFGASYKLDNLGTLKAQSLGGVNASKALYEIVNVAFDYTAIDGLWASAGVFVNTDSVDHPFGNDSGYLPTVNITGLYRVDATASYTLGAAKLNGLGEYIVHQAGDPSLELGAGVDYALDDGVTLVSDVRYMNKTAGVAELKATDAVMGGFVGVKKSLGAGTVGLGLAYSTSTFATWGNGLVANDDPTKAHFAIPVRVEYSF